MPKPKIGRKQYEPPKGSRAYPPKPQGAKNPLNSMAEKVKRSIGNPVGSFNSVANRIQKNVNKNRLDAALKSSQDQALRKTVINPPAMNSVAPPKVEGVRPERPTRKTSTRNELEKAFRKQQKKKY